VESQITTGFTPALSMGSRESQVQLTSATTYKPGQFPLNQLDPTAVALAHNLLGWYHTGLRGLADRLAGSGNLTSQLLLSICEAVAGQIYVDSFGPGSGYSGLSLDDDITTIMDDSYTYGYWFVFYVADKISGHVIDEWAEDWIAGGEGSSVGEKLAYYIGEEFLGALA